LLIHDEALVLFASVMQIEINAKLNEFPLKNLASPVDVQIVLLTNQCLYPFFVYFFIFYSFFLHFLQHLRAD